MKKLTTSLTAVTLTTALVLTGCVVRPKPITRDVRDQRVQSDLAQMYANQEPVSEKIDLYDATARAIKYSLDARLKLMETVLSGHELNLSGYDMLPQLAADAGFTNRSNNYVSFSEDPATGQRSRNSSSSQDKNRRLANIDTTWNVLDFGVSYMASKQKADAYLIAVERRRKMTQNIIRDVNYAYWRAVTAQRLSRELAPLKAQVAQALSQSQTANNEKVQSPLVTLEYRKSLLETQREIGLLYRDINNAKRELGALMNVPPGTSFTLIEPKNLDNVLPSDFPTDLRLLENIALRDRPELREEDYRTRIAANEIRKARLRMLPGLEFNGGGHYDSNSFLLNKTWASYGLQLTWNLMRVVAGPAAIRTAKAAKEVADVRRMALSMAVMTQVDIAYMRYTQSKEERHIAHDLQEVDTAIYQHLQKEEHAQKATQLQLIRARMNKVLATLRYDLMYAEWQNAGGHLLSSIGYDPVFDINLNDNIPTLSASLRHNLNVKHVYRLPNQGVAGTTQVAVVAPQKQQENSKK